MCFGKISFSLRDYCKGTMPATHPHPNILVLSLFCSTVAINPGPEAIHHRLWCRFPCVPASGRTRRQNTMLSGDICHAQLSRKELVLCPFRGSWFSNPWHRRFRSRVVVTGRSVFQTASDERWQCHANYLCRAQRNISRKERNSMNLGAIRISPKGGNPLS